MQRINKKASSRKKKAKKKKKAEKKKTKAFSQHLIKTTFNLRLIFLLQFQEDDDEVTRA